jgi:hypothetical protein
MGGQHDAFIQVIIVERIAKSVVLIAGAIGLLTAGAAACSPSRRTSPRISSTSTRATTSYCSSR